MPTVTPTEVGVPKRVGDVVRLASAMALDWIVTSLPAVITASPTAIVAEAVESKI